MVTIELRIADDRIDVSVGEGSWRASYDTTMTVSGPDKQGGGRVIGFAGHGDLSGVTPGSTVHRAFDAARFEPDISVAATIYVCGQAQTGIGQSALRMLFTRPLVNIVWPDWNEIPAEARVAYLRGSARNDGVVAYADVAVNGRPAATWSRSRRLMCRSPSVAKQTA